MRQSKNKIFLLNLVLYGVEKAKPVKASASYIFADASE